MALAASQDPHAPSARVRHGLLHRTILKPARGRTRAAHRIPSANACRELRTMIDLMHVTYCGLAAAIALSGAAAAGAEPATGLDLTGMNRSIRPQDDLFGSMNGKWIDDTPIPPDKAEYGVFYQLRDRSDERVKGLIEELAASSPSKDSAPGKVAAFYRAFL